MQLRASPCVRDSNPNPPTRAERRGKAASELKLSNELRERDLVLRHICREVRVLQEHIADLNTRARGPHVSQAHNGEHQRRTHQPRRVIDDLTGRDAGNAGGARVVRLREDEVARVDGKLLVAERERDARVGVARDREPALPVVLRAVDELVHRGGVRGRRDDERGAGVEDRAAAREARVRAVDGHGVHRALPEAVRRDVVEGDERLRIELAGVEPAERDLAVVLVVCEAGDLEGRDRVADQACRREGLDGRGDTLFRERLQRMGKGTGSATRSHAIWRVR